MLTPDSARRRSESGVSNFAMRCSPRRRITRNIAANGQERRKQHLKSWRQRCPRRRQMKRLHAAYTATSMPKAAGKWERAHPREPRIVRSFLIRPWRGVWCIGSPDGLPVEFSRAESGVAAKGHLRWFVGSGRVARSYLSSLDGFLFQSPVSYIHWPAWDIFPIQQHRSHSSHQGGRDRMLQCHATAYSRSPARRTVSATRPFGKEASAASDAMDRGKTRRQNDFRQSQRTAEIVNPVKLDAAPA